MIKKSRLIRDLCGNEYFIQEAQDMQGIFLEVSEVVNLDGQKGKTYLCDIDMSFNSSDDDILDEIDDIKSKLADY